MSIRLRRADGVQYNNSAVTCCCAALGHIPPRLSVYTVSLIINNILLFQYRRSNYDVHIEERLTRFYTVSQNVSPV